MPGVSWPKRFVYILKSLANPDEYYVGVTSNMSARLAAHNEGLSPHTASLRPWKSLVVIEWTKKRQRSVVELYGVPNARVSSPTCVSAS